MIKKLSLTSLQEDLFFLDRREFRTMPDAVLVEAAHAPAEVCSPSRSVGVMVSSFACWHIVQRIETGQLSYVQF